MMPEFLGYEFMQRALVGGVLGGGALSFLGLYVVLRRLVFLGAALPQFSAFGIAGAALVELPPLLGAVVGAVLGVTFLPVLRMEGRLPPDGVVGIGYALTSSLAILLLAFADDHHFRPELLLAGDLLGISAADLWIVGGAVLATALLHLLCWRTFKLTSYDPELASALGYRVKVWDALLFLSLGIVLAVVMRISGAIVTFAYLVGPSSAALLLFRRFSLIIPVTIVLGAMGTVAGLWASFTFDLPGGPTVAAAVVLPVVPAVIYRYL